MYLIDTSLWIRHFRNRDDFDLSTVCSPDDRVLCLPVYQELLQGVRDESHYRSLREILKNGVFVENPLTQDLYVRAVDLYRLARKKGLTVRSSTDCLIAACAIKNDLEVLHSDRDYSLLTNISALKQRAF